MTVTSSFHTVDRTDGTGGYEGVIFPLEMPESSADFEMELQSKEMQRALSFLQRSLSTR